MGDINDIRFFDKVGGELLDLQIKLDNAYQIAEKLIGLYPEIEENLRGAQSQISSIGDSLTLLENEIIAKHNQQYNEVLDE